MTRAQKVLGKKAAFRDGLERRFPSDEAARIWADAESRLDGIFRSYGGLAKGVRAHTDAFIFPAAAIYLAAREFSQEKAFALMQEVMKAKSLKSGEAFRAMTRLPGGKAFFLKMWDSVSRRSFSESAGFKNVFYPRKKGEFKMDITQCPYQTYFSQLGCPELTRLFCQNDEYAYGNLDGLRFVRTQTLGTGGTLCDFLLVKEKA